MNRTILLLTILTVWLTGCQTSLPLTKLDPAAPSTRLAAQTTITSTPSPSPEPTTVLSTGDAKTPTGVAITATGVVKTPTGIVKTPTLLPQTSTPSATPTVPPITQLLFTGVIVPARCVQAAIDKNGDPNYPYQEVKDIIQQADLAIGTFNATMSDYPPHTGCVRTFVLVGGSNNADALQWAGFDVMSVATNHIKNCGLTNCGDRAFFDTLENLRRVGILPVGAGSNHEEAMRPVVVELNGVRFGFISLGQIEPMAFAGEDKPGIAVLTDENLKKAIQDARLVSDVVIAMPHWGPEYASVPNWIQRDLAKKLVEAGADLVVGNHTHVVQALQEIDGIPVFYGLGNFVFDQDLPELQQGVILVVNFQGSDYKGYELIPTHVDQDGLVHIAGVEEASEILERIGSASQALR